MGLTRNFFTQPILVAITFRETVEKDGQHETVDYPVSFKMNRETVGQRNAIEVAAGLFNDKDNFERFCRQLAEPPKGIDDFPGGDSPLQERARQYFAPEGYKDLIQYVLMEVERAQKPVEFFRSF